MVVVNYEGKNRKGKVFDSSYERNEPAEFPLNRVIKGWTEGMKLVGKGGKITLWIPAELAYGERGAGRDIGANEALEFSVEVVDVKPYVEPRSGRQHEGGRAGEEVIAVGVSYGKSVSSGDTFFDHCFQPIY